MHEVGILSDTRLFVICILFFLRAHTCLYVYENRQFDHHIFKIYNFWHVEGYIQKRKYNNPTRNPYHTRCVVCPFLFSFTSCLTLAIPPDLYRQSRRAVVYFFSFLLFFFYYQSLTLTSWESRTISPWLLSQLTDYIHTQTHIQIPRSSKYYVRHSVGAIMTLSS